MFFSPFFASFFHVFLLTHLPSLYSLLLLGLFFTPFLFTSVSFNATSLFRGDYHCSAGLTGISMLHLAAALTVLPMLRVPPALMRSLDCLPRPGACHDIRQDTALSWLHCPFPTTAQARFGKCLRGQSALWNTVARPTFPNFSPSVMQ